MIRALIFLALLAVLPTPGQVGSAALYTEFEYKPTPAVVQAIQEEIDFLMAPNGLHLEWRSLPEDSQTTWTELAVVKFSGQCEALPFATNSHADQRLGWTHISDGVVLPFAEVDCEAIRAHLLKEMALLLPQTREKAFGRAVGRVTAHELLHIFAQTTVHSDHGVDHPTLTVSQLLADHTDVIDGEVPVHIVRANPTVSPVRRGLASDGKVSYIRAGCANCHGGNGEGSSSGPALRISGRILNPVTLAAKLAKSQEKMWQRARNMKVAHPSVSEDEISDLVSFLNGVGY